MNRKKQELLPLEEKTRHKVNAKEGSFQGKVPDQVIDSFTENKPTHIEHRETPQLINSSQACRRGFQTRAIVTHDTLRKNMLFANGGNAHKLGLVMNLP